MGSHRHPANSIIHFFHTLNPQPFECVWGGSLFQEDSRVEVEESVTNRNVSVTGDDFLPRSQYVNFRIVREPTFRSKVDDFLAEAHYVDLSMVGQKE